MACSETLRAQRYFDGELDAASAAVFEAHLETCSACRAQLKELRDGRDRLRHGLADMRAPARLRAGIVAALDAEERAAARPREQPTWRAPAFWFGALAGVGGSALAACAVLFLLMPAPASVLDALVAAHVRSLMSQSLTDVVSTDRHTVKPWFAGHADVSPAVADFAGQGYRLVGGRADYLDHQRAAVLVYQHGAHFINVFSWVDRHTLPHHAVRDGYHMVFWNAGGLEYCAVSDAGWDELSTLAGLLQALAGADARE